MKAKPANFVMGEPVPYGQTYNYHTADPLEAVLTDGYFMPLRSFLRRGDTIRITRVEDERVVELVDIIVTYCAHERVDIAKLGEVFSFDPVPQVAAEVNSIKTSHTGLHVKRGFGCFEVRNAANKVLAEFSTKDDATAYKEELEAG